MPEHRDHAVKLAPLTKSTSPTACAEHGKWTTPPSAPPHHKVLDFATIDAAENQRIISSGSMTFTMVGCSGDPDTPANTDAVAAAMTSAAGSSFFYHLGDITYTPDEKAVARARMIQPRTMRSSASTWTVICTDRCTFGSSSSRPSRDPSRRRS
jgi:hypothetical protein